MKYTLSLLALALAMSALPAMAENGNVPQDTLAAMGLGDIAPLSDEQGQAVKGKYAFAYSISGTGVPGAFNVSAAGASGKYFATAESESRSSSHFSAYGFGFFGGHPFGYGFAGFGVSAHFSARSSGEATAFAF